MNFCTYSGILPNCPGRILLGSLGAPVTLSDYSLECGLLQYLANAPAIACIIPQARIFPGFIPRELAANSSTFPAAVYSLSGDDEGAILSGSAGFSWADLEIDVWAQTKQETVQASAAIRLALVGFSGYWGAVQIGNVLFDGKSDRVEKPGDGSGTWYFSRENNFRVLYSVPVPKF